MQASGQYHGYVPGPDGQPVRLPARFYWREKKISEMPPQFEKRAYIEIYHIGGDTTDRPIREDDKVNYPREWAAFEKNQDQSEIGWSIRQVPFLDCAQAATYEAMGIRTLEALSIANDAVGTNVMGFRKHRDQAIAMLDAAKSAKPIEELTKKNHALEDKVKLLEAQISELCEKMDKDKKVSK